MQKANLERGLRNVSLDLQTSNFYVFVDGSFANNVDLLSQIGYVVILANESKQEDQKFAITGNIVRYISTKRK